MEQHWIDWCQKQFAEVSAALNTQGYTPERIECLTLVSSDFATCFNRFMEDTGRVMEAMTANPDGYHHYEAFEQAKIVLLKCTSEHRERFLNRTRVEVA